MVITRKIEEYLDGTLDEKEKILFEILAHGNVKLAEMIALHKEVNESIKDNDLYTLRKLLKQVSDSFFMPKSPASFLGNRWIFRHEHKHLCH